jgi:hypothetical protein
LTDDSFEELDSETLDSLISFFFNLSNENWKVVGIVNPYLTKEIKLKFELPTNDISNFNIDYELVEKEINKLLTESLPKLNKMIEFIKKGKTFVRNIKSKLESKTYEYL